jgi:hypothetical protein
MVHPCGSVPAEGLVRHDRLGVQDSQVVDHPDLALQATLYSTRSRILNIKDGRSFGSIGFLVLRQRYV